ncbi:hypothetical protein BLOT_011523 [Blomia tropicalis]|nr:hypothetical protein BLOT_011523 [Blomia tropicalis]
MIAFYQNSQLDNVSFAFVSFIHWEFSVNEKDDDHNLPSLSENKPSFPVSKALLCFNNSANACGCLSSFIHFLFNPLLWPDFQIIVPSTSSSSIQTNDSLKGF